ncbi:Mechanosensitive ion channel [Vibrio sp. B1ASS3]|uniref:mechanosensitive ion channel family protein n=1 Tax=Vibrio sp. B1ASS3 TaxID=2751176 RepID=UPI001ABB2663|nr:mechanosensitive ion channel family protein [Vibrio sp. B1ASS3]CAD7815395.1 Mechanosensitive ion channel [Vibrio sp. B1ASS3]CAE6925135.1 Mechanosensitive ion channel [Vibrio sp. B1ASS3]
MKTITSSMLSVCCVLFTFFAQAEEAFPLAPPDLSSPQKALTSFETLVSQANQQLTEIIEDPTQNTEPNRQNIYALFDKATQAFDLSEVPESGQNRVAIESVMLMKEILDRAPPLDLTLIPDSNTLDRWQIPDTGLELIKQADGQYRFSEQTVHGLYSDYLLVKHLPSHSGADLDYYQYYSLSAGRLIPPTWFHIVETLPSVFMLEYGDQAIWQWLGLVLSLSLTISVLALLYNHIHSPILKAICAVITLSGFLYLADYQLNLTGILMSTLNVIIELICWLLLSQVAYLLIYKTCRLLMSKQRTNTTLRQSLTQIIGTLLGSMAAIACLGYGLNRLGVPVYGIVTGLSLGGMAIALAIRPTMENLIGGVILFLDKSLSVGDYCQIGSQSGVIEQIGVRSTRIRAKDRTQITIANGDLIKREIINYSRRDRYPFKATIGLRYETRMSQLQSITEKITSLLKEHPDVLDSPLRVHFSAFNAYSLDIEILAHLNTTNRETFLNLQQELLILIDKIIAAEGAQFAFPSSTTYLATDTLQPAVTPKTVQAVPQT